MAVKELAAESERVYGAAIQVIKQTGAATTGELRQLKQVLNEAQRELRDIKRRLAEEEKTIRLQSQEKRAKVAGQGQLLGLFVNSKARGSLARGRAASRQSISKRETAALQPYRNVKADLDKRLNHLQSLKEATDSELAKLKAVESSSAKEKPVSTSPAPPPPPPTPPVWAADPAGRSELRYWDGARWTEHVSDQGVQGVDPL
jgi:hypothetical protein